MLSFLNAILGIVLLVAGRKLFWLMVGIIGFIVGAQVATRFFQGSEIITIIAGLVLGFIFAILAVFLESLAIGLAGFLGGGYILLSVANLSGLDSRAITWVIFIFGGIVGLVLILAFLDWALIIISSLAGASMIVDAFHLKVLVAGGVFLILLVLGIIIQASALPGDRGTKEHPYA